MVARADTPRLTPPASPSIAAAGGLVAGALVAIGCLAIPSGLLESLVVHSGVAALVNAAAPPLGFTARAVLALGGGLLTAAVAWAVLVLVAGERRLPTAWPAIRLPALRRKAVPGVPTVRRADSHPDAPPRPPILAERDLGLPFLSVVAPETARAEAVPAAPVRPAILPETVLPETVLLEPTPPVPADERPLPADLDTALAAIDPAAIPEVPREPVRPVAPLVPVAAAPRPAASPASAPPLAPGERIDSIELGADVRDQPESIESLLARLERGARRRPVLVDEAPAVAAPSRPDPAPTPATPTPPAAPPEPRAGSLEETLGSLRRLAMRG